MSDGGFSSDGKVILTASEDGTVRVFDPKNGTPLYVFQGHGFHTDVVTCIQTHPTNNSIVMTGSADTTAKILNIQTGKVLGTLTGHTDSIETVGFCENLPLVATGSLDKNLNIWDANSTQLRGSCTHEVIKYFFVIHFT